MIADESISEIYACHILEHVNRNNALTVLQEWGRVLEPNGEIRVAVPDFEAVVEEYCLDRDATRLQGLLYGGQTYEYNFHYVAYDFQMLKKLLEDAGFKDVGRYDWRDFLPADYDDFSRAYMPHMEFESGRLMSLNILARKK
jgi:predicted SAM-dependent methyltransferase